MGFPPTVENQIPREREPIHGTGWIQPHGVLLSLDGSGRIVRLGGDTRRALGVAPEALLGQGIDTLADADGRKLADTLPEHRPPLPCHVARWRPQPPGEGSWDVTMHVAGTDMLVELEPVGASPRGSAGTLNELSRTMAALDAAPDLDALLQSAVDAVRRITQFDRVGLFRLLDGDAGMIVAEARGGGLPSALGLPLSGTGVTHEDRAPYLRGCLRVVPDTDHAPAPLRSINPAHAADRPDLDHCVLRGLPLVQARRLAQMGIRAMFTIPLVVEGRLWGLIACHHDRPRPVPYESRELGRQIGRMLSRQIEAHELAERRRERATLRGRWTAWLDELRAALQPGQTLDLDPVALAALLPCDGAAIVAPGRIAVAGRTPDEADLAALAAWLDARPQQDVFATRHLTAEFPELASCGGHVRGLLATRVGTDEPTQLLWFRGAETAHERPAGVRDASPFSGASSRPAPAWSRATIGAARELGRALTVLFQQQAVRELDRRLHEAWAEQQALIAQKNLMMQEVHHRVQNSLQTVNSMLQLQARQSSDPAVRDPFDRAVNRLMAASAVHRHLWQFNDSQEVRLGPYLEQLCADLMLSWGEQWAGHVTVSAVEVVIPSHMAMTLALLVTELLTNAAKYAYAGAPGPVGVEVALAEDGRLQVSVRDHGQGMQTEVQGSGLGSRLIRVFTQQLGGRVDTQTGAAGTHVTIALPLPQPRDAAATGRAAPA